MTWYVVSCGRQTGVFSSWEAYHAQVNGYKGACYRAYKCKDDAFAAFCGENKLEFSRVVSHPANSVSWKDVTIVAQALIILILISVIFLS